MKLRTLRSAQGLAVLESLGIFLILLASVMQALSSARHLLDLRAARFLVEGALSEITVASGRLINSEGDQVAIEGNGDEIARALLVCMNSLERDLREMFVDEYAESLRRSFSVDVGYVLYRCERGYADELAAKGFGGPSRATGAEAYAPIIQAIRSVLWEQLPCAQEEDGWDGYPRALMMVRVIVDPPWSPFVELSPIVEYALSAPRSLLS